MIESLEYFSDYYFELCTCVLYFVVCQHVDFTAYQRPRNILVGALEIGQLRLWNELILS